MLISILHESSDFINFLFFLGILPTFVVPIILPDFIQNKVALFA